MATHCPKCSHRFSPHLTHLPHILPCLHVLCSSCVNPTPHPGQIQCFHPQCLCVVSEDDARALVIDRHLLGSINIYQKDEPLGMTDTSAQFLPLTTKATYFSIDNLFQVQNLHLPVDLHLLLDQLLLLLLFQPPAQNPSHVLTPSFLLPRALIQWCAQHLQGAWKTVGVCVCGGSQDWVLSLCRVWGSERKDGGGLDRCGEGDQGVWDL